MVDYQQIITIEPGKRGGKPTIRGMRITVGDILGWLASGRTDSSTVKHEGLMNALDIDI